MTPRLLDYTPLEIQLSPPRVVRALCWIVLCFALMHLAGATVVALAGREQLHRMGVLLLIDQFNMNEEMNLPTYYSSFLLAFGGGLLLLTARRIRGAGGPMVFQWRLLGVCFLAMSFDEFGGIHERIGSFLTLHTHAPQHGVLHYNWLIFGLPFVAASGCLFLPFLLNLPARLRNALILAGAVYVGGALGLESFGSWYADRYGEENLGYALEVVFEESAEMLGVILMIRCLLRELAERAGEIHVICRERMERPAATMLEMRTPARSGRVD